MGAERFGSSPAARRGSSRVAGTAIVVLVAFAVLIIGTGPVPRGPASGGTPLSSLSSHGVTPVAALVVRATPAPGAIPRPAAFTLIVAGLTPAAIALSWSGSGLLITSNYTVQYSLTGAAGSWTTVAVVQPPTTSYVQSGLSPGGTFYWQVIAYGLGSAISNTVAPTQPTLAFLNYTNPSPSSAKFTWTNNATYGGGLSFSEYDLFERSGTSAPVKVANITQASGTNATIPSLSAGVSYSFYLETVDCTPGCPTATTVTQSNTVTYGPPLALSVTVTAQRSVVDTGQLDYLTCTPSGGTPPYTFQWDFGNGTFVPGASSLSHGYAAANTYSVTCQVTDHAGTRASQATAVLVNPRPSLVLTENRTAADVGQSIDFGCTASQGTPPFTVQWTFGDGSAGANSPVTHSYSSHGLYVVSCIATDQTSTVVGASVTVSVSPTLGAVATVDHPAAAPGSSLSFQVHPMNGSGLYASPIAWNFGDGSTVRSSGDTATHAFPTAGTFTVRATVNDSNGASVAASTIVTIAPIMVHLLSEPRAESVNARATFSASANGGAGGPFNFTWQFSDGNAAFGATVNHTFRSAGTIGVTLTVRDVLGATNATELPSVSVTGPTAWLTSAVLALVALLVGIVLAVVGYVWLRQRERDRLHAQSGRVPMTPPSEMVQGAKTCRWCGTSNLPLRDTCVNCGRSLRRT